MAIDTQRMADDTIALVERIAHDWGAEFVRTRRAEVNRIRVRSTGALHDSIRYQLLKRSRGRWVIRVNYNFYGKFHDKGIKNQMPSGGKAYILNLTNWVLRKGLHNFTPRRRGSTEATARDIAWGIARNNSDTTPWPPLRSHCE